MKLYDECLIGVDKLLNDYTANQLQLDKSIPWQDVGKNQIIFQNDTAYELGGGNYPAISSIALTDNADFVPCDQVLLCGNDLPDLKKDTPFARIALIRVNEGSMGSGDALYQAIRKIEYTRYHLNPEGYMMRISAFTHREAVRISKASLKKGLCFSRVGELFINAYHRQPQVEAVKLIFITDPNFPYDELSKIMQKSESITKALDHIMKNIKMDCNACNLKDVCAEVEQLCNKNQS